MNRSRTVLLIAWGLLALGALFQLIGPETGDSATDEQIAYREGGGAGVDDPAAGGTSSGGNSDRPGVDGGGTIEDAVAYGNEPLRPRPTVPLLADDPSVWTEAGVVLDSEAYVATVTSEGVASMSEPEPGPVQHWFPSPTQFGGDRAFLVVDQTSSEDYVKVSLPVMPNGQEGWILRSEVEITEVRHRALIDLSDDTITVWDGDGVIVDTKAVTGKQTTPTPLGMFYIRDIIAQDDPGGSFGPYILALSGFSEVMETFQGGLPALAIHGTDNPSQIGTEQSSGCVRIPNDLISILAESVPLGTPVTVIA
ncbi:MAG: L,D-transpeptidase [Acidimicrobiales bacterium]